MAKLTAQHLDLDAGVLQIRRAVRHADVVRSVSENSTTLSFAIHDFEDKWPGEVG